jgi:UDP-N-acetylmuramate: L-alanyl-gamma-D-glutamyl-meso-diaminopimelate ligase
LIDDVDEIVASVAAKVRAEDVIIVMSNGSFAGIHAKLLAALGS